MRGKRKRGDGLNAPLGTPRVCGENLAGESVELLLAGTPPAYARKTTKVADYWDGTDETPPRMRGKPQLRYAVTASAGNTPAYAGKTLRRQRVYEPKPGFSITSSDKPHTTADVLGASKPKGVSPKFPRP